MNNKISNSILYIILFILTVLVGIGLYYKYLDIKNEEKRQKRKQLKKRKEGLKMGNSIGAMFKIIATFPKRLLDIGMGMANIFKGIGLTYYGIYYGTALGFKDIVLLFYYGSYFVFTYTICGVQYITNLPKCFFYYIVDIFFQLIYLPVRLMLFVIWIFYNKIYKYESLVWKYIDKADIMQYDFTGIRVTRWPKSIRYQCYNCKRLKISVLMNKGQDIYKDFMVKIPKMLLKGVNTVSKGGKKMLGGFF
jgi:hypothetical protein